MPKTNFLTFCWRTARIFLHTLTGLTLATLVLPVCGRRGREQLIRWWCAKLLRCFNLQLSVSGVRPAPQSKHVLFVANHISWSDIHALNSLIPVRFVAKVEIKDWPVFGYLVKKSGTIFINRTRQRDAARVLKVVTQAMKLGDNLCVFPEGTTTDGQQVLPFKSSLIQAAIDAEATVIPIAIHYPMPDGSPNLAAAYAGETSMIESMLSFLNMQSPKVHLHFCAPIEARLLDRQTLASQARNEIMARLPWATVPETVSEPAVQKQA
ncbi:1-acylglycerol-3-phosphate O-acyltransferase [Methylophilus sp. YYY-1]|nr:1-acylglycerol-3-phosphate O-acyltransferase [Methylophilus sp. YYY-1]